MKNIKKIVVLAMTCIIVLTGAVACGNGSASKKLSKGEYKEEVQRILDAIGDKTSTVSEGLDTDTDEGKAELVNKVKAELLPLYEELGALTAPEELKVEQEKIKAGADAFVEIFSLADDQEAMRKKMQELGSVLLEFSTATATVLGLEELTTGEATTQTQ